MVTARQGLDAAIEAVGTGLQDTTSMVLDLVNAGSFMSLVQDVFDVGKSEAEARVMMGSVRSLAALRLVQLTSVITKAVDTIGNVAANDDSALLSGSPSTPSPPSGTGTGCPASDSSSPQGRNTIKILQDLKLLVEETVATRMVFETDQQVRTTLTNVHEFARMDSLKDGFKGAAAAIQVNISVWHGMTYNVVLAYRSSFSSA